MVDIRNKVPTYENDELNGLIDIAVFSGFTLALGWLCKYALGTIKIIMYKLKKKIISHLIFLLFFLLTFLFLFIISYNFISEFRFNYFL